MYKVTELARIAGVTMRTLHHYDRIGLLVPAARSEAGYRLYSDEDPCGPRMHGAMAALYTADERFATSIGPHIAGLAGPQGGVAPVDAPSGRIPPTGG